MTTTQTTTTDLGLDFTLGTVDGVAAPGATYAATLHPDGSLYALYGGSWTYVSNPDTRATFTPGGTPHPPHPGPCQH